MLRLPRALSRRHPLVSCSEHALARSPPPPLHPPSPPPPGFVFLAFGFNWVDAGGLLGGRLDEDVVRVPASAKVGLQAAGWLAGRVHGSGCPLVAAR